MLKLEWTQAARRDLLEIIKYIAEDDPDAAQRLKDAIESSVDRLLMFPESCPPGRVPGTRELVVHPHYVVVYIETHSAVRMLRVLHTARQWPPPTYS